MTPISPEIFRAYDIRGIFNETLRLQDGYLIGQALASYLKKQGQLKMIMGRDNRISSPAFSEAVKQGLLESGCDVIDIGEVPTPLLYFATCKLDTNNGIMITASHNPANYNGVKMVINGQALPPKSIQELYQIIKSSNFISGQGHYSQENITPTYLKEIAQQINLKKTLKVVIDCANAVASSFAPKLLRQLNCEVVELFCEPNGNFPNHEPDPSDPGNLSELTEQVKAEKADLGIAYDGDADRVFVVDQTGRSASSDQLIMLYAKAILSEHPHAKLVYDIKCSHLLASVISKLGGVHLLSRTGHTFIKAMVKEENALFGGEASGHFVFNDRWYGFDDALYSSARLLEFLDHSQKSLAQLLDELPKSVLTPEIKLPIEEADKFSFIEQFKTGLELPKAKLITVDGIRIEFPDCWGLVRPSNTSPYLVFRFEADNEERLSFIQTLFRERIQLIKPELACPF